MVRLATLLAAAVGPNNANTTLIRTQGPTLPFVVRSNGMIIIRRIFINSGIIALQGLGIVCCVRLPVT